jgi:signal transduction histidine kinase/CHASE3 domain sensor protein
VRLLSSALFWRILLSSLLVVGVLGFGVYRSARAYEELESQFERLVSHDLKLADDAEVMLRLMADLETGKRGFLLTNDRTFLEPYERARKDVDRVLLEAQATAENGMEDERVAAFGRLMHEWITTVSEPQIHELEAGGSVNPETTALGKARTDEMREIATQLRNEAVHAASAREAAAFDSASASRQTTNGVLLLAIVIALASGTWIARDVANAAAHLEEALDATGRLQPPTQIPARHDELGAVGERLLRVGGLLIEKDASLRATLSDRERAVAELTAANANLADRDANARAYAEFVRQLKTLDVRALASAGLEGLVALGGGNLGVVYLLDGADRLVPIHAYATDARAAVDHRLLGADGLPRAVMDRREPMVLRGDELGPVRPRVDLGVATIALEWLLAQPVAVGDEAAGTVVIGGTKPLAPSREEIVRDAARQLGVGLHNAWTHDRLREKSVMLAEQGESLARAVKVKTEFLASMSHELRTPLSAILGFADLLVTSPKEQLSPRARESLERIKRNGEHLLGLINDILELAKAETGRLDVRLAPVNLSQLARSCVAEVESLRTANDLQLRAEVPDAVEARTDAQRVRQILLNLLSNALKFTERGEVVLSVTASDSEVRLEVRDTGIGIPAHAMNELFRDFHQLDVGDGRKFAGTGIGLALSRRLARALGGEIEVRSREGEGSAFTLILPRSLALGPESRQSLTPMVPPSVASVTSITEPPPSIKVLS